MKTQSISESLIAAFEEGFENIASRYPNSGTKAKVRLVRRILGLSQKEFAKEIGVPFSTVRNWEQPNKGEPKGAAKTLIDLLSEEPNTVRRILRQARDRDDQDEKNLEQAVEKTA